MVTLLQLSIENTGSSSVTTTHSLLPLLLYAEISKHGIRQFVDGAYVPPPGKYGLIFGYVVPGVAVDIGAAVGADGSHRIVGTTSCISWSLFPSAEISLLLGRDGYDKLFYYIVAAINSKISDSQSYTCVWPQRPQDTTLVSRW